MSKGESTKDSLVTAASTLFAKSGIQWVSFQQIANEVGVSQPALYRHFRDKDDLVLACAQKAALVGRDIIDKNIDPYSSADSQLKSYIEGNFIWAEKRRDDAVMILAIYYFAYNDAAARSMFLAINEQSIERISIKIAAGQREGLWRDIDPASTARSIHNLLIGEIIKMIHTPKEFTRKDRISQMWSAITRILAA